MGTLFALLFGRAFDKMGKKANICPKLTKNAYFGPILAVFGPKILIFMGVSKSFGTNITENHFGNLSALFFGQASDQMGQKCQWYIYPQFWNNFNETWWNHPGYQKNDPEGQRTRSGPELRRNGRFYVRPKSGFWPKNGQIWPKTGIWG